MRFKAFAWQQVNYEDHATEDVNEWMDQNNVAMIQDWKVLVVGEMYTMSLFYLTEKDIPEQSEDDGFDVEITED